MRSMGNFFRSISNIPRTTALRQPWPFAQLDSRRRIETWAERGRVTTSRQKNFRRRDTGSSRTGVPADRSVLSRGRSSARARFSFLRAVRQCPIRPNEVTGVAVRIFLQIILMLGLGLPERSGGCHLGDNLARPKAASVDVGNGVFRDPLLLVAGIEDGRSV